MADPRPPRVFVSYSRDSDAHVAKAEQLAAWLRQEGVDAEIDRYAEPGPPNGWARYLIEQVETAAFVVVVVSPGWVRRAEGRNETASLDGTLILAELQRQTTSRIVPVLFDDEPDTTLPGWLVGRTPYRLPQGYRDLYAHLTGQAGIPRPPLGALAWAPTSRAEAPAPKRPEAPAPRAWRDLPDRAKRYGPGTPDDVLLATVEVAADRTWWTFSVPRGGDPLARWERDLGGLDALFRWRRLPTVDRTLAGLESGDRSLPDDAPLLVGSALGEWVFGPGGSDDRARLFRGLFGHQQISADPGPSLRPVRLRLDLGDPFLRGLPWNLLADGDQFLLDSGWTVEHRVPGDEIPSVELPNPCHVLAILPLNADDTLGTRWHEAALTQRLRGLWGDRARDHLTIVRGYGELRALRLAPSIVYVYAPLSPTGNERGNGDPLLTLDSPSGTETRRLSNLLVPLKDDPPVVVLNLIGWEGDPRPPARPTPAPRCLVDISASAPPAHASEAGLDWIETLLRHHLDPVAATATLPPRSLAHRLVSVGTRFRSFRTHPAGAADRAERIPSNLDRFRARAMCTAHLGELVKREGRRSLSIVATADDPRHRLGELASILKGWLVPRDREQKCVLSWQSLTLPATISVDVLEQTLARLPFLPEYGKPLKERLTAWARRQDARYTPVIWMDWGTVGEGTERGPLLRKELQAWLDIGTGTLASACPANARIVSMLSIGTKNHDTVAEIAANAGTSAGAVVTLDRLSDVPMGDLVMHLESEDSSCPKEESRRRAVAAALFARSGGSRSEDAHFDRLVDELQQAERCGWGELEREGALLLRPMAEIERL